MKKSVTIMLAVALLFSASLKVNAQFSQKENYREPKCFHMGMRGGFSMKKLGNEDLVSPYGGFSFDFQIIPEPLFLETGIYYMNIGYDNNWIAYINIPLLLSYHFYINPNSFIQPFLGGVGGCECAEGNYESALRLGCGFNYGRLYLNVGCDLGLTKHRYYTYLPGDDKYLPYWEEHRGTYTIFFATFGFNFAGSR